MVTGTSGNVKDIRRGWGKYDGNITYINVWKLISLFSGL
jgi:hypothetical protein